MQRVFTFFPLLAMLALIVASPASAEQTMPINPSTCLQCHGHKINASAFAPSVHGKYSCTSCHISIVVLD
ncbi:MAG: cytochrome C, partial [Geobacteraceae bacterium]|nr:cytochrome C [Geobacteraceae bacterium]